MDRLNRLTRLEEFQLGGWYYWLKGKCLRGPLICDEIAFKEDCVVLREAYGRAGHGYTTYGWRGRYVSQLHISMACRPEGFRDDPMRWVETGPNGAGYWDKAIIPHRMIRSEFDQKIATLLR